MADDGFASAAIAPRTRLPQWKKWLSRHSIALDYLPSAIRYRPFDSARDLDPDAAGYLANIITTGTVFIPAASTFNDPWEAAPSFEHVRWVRDREREVADFLAFLSPQLDTPEKLASLTADIRRLGHDAVLREGQRILFEKLRTTPILSLSDRADNFLMWSYYAAGHNGYGLVFDAAVPPIAAAVRVKYSSRHPAVYLNQRDMRGIAVQVLATKARQWRHEREWRVIASQHNAERMGFQRLRPASERGYYAQLPRNALVGVIVGDQLFNSSHGNDVLDLLRKAPLLRAWVAEINRRAFRIVLRPLRFEV